MYTADISIVVPFLNECEGIGLFCQKIDEHAKMMNSKVELIFVDDGSTDNSVDILENYFFENIYEVKIVTLSKNYGSHAAIRAGMLYASFDICTWMGSDLQEPMEFLESSIEKIREGFDAIYIEKKSIDVSKTTRLFSQIFAKLIRRYAVKNFASGGISNIVFNNKIKTMLNQNIESNSAINLQIMDAGFKTVTLSMDFSERAAGVSKWTFSKKIKLFIDSFVAFSFIPIRLVSIVGIIIFFVGIIIGVSTLINRIVNPEVPIGYSTMTSILALGFGVTNISLGIIAEYLWRAYDAARKRPVFVVSDVLEVKKTKDE